VDLKLFVVILPMLLIVGCVKEPANAPFCDKPYMQVGGDCCLDEDEDMECDVNETTYAAQNLILSQEEIQGILGADWTNESFNSCHMINRSDNISVFCRGYTEGYVTINSSTAKKDIVIHIAVYDTIETANKTYADNIYAYDGFRNRFLNIKDYESLDVGDSGRRSQADSCEFIRKNVLVNVGIGGSGYGNYAWNLLPNYTDEVMQVCRLQDEKIMRLL
jgi:hypothetical protein